MTTTRWFHKVATFFVSIVMCSLAQGAEKVGDAEWKAQMQGLLGDVLVLFPYAFNEASLRDPKNSQAVGKALESLAQHSIGLQKHTAQMDGPAGLKLDPSFPFIAQAFEDEVKLAQSSFSEGPGSYPRTQSYLRAALTKCMACHTQSDSGPELKLAEFRKTLNGLSMTDRFVALTVTRQFDEALQEFAGTARAAKSKKADAYTFDQNARVALAIAVRVKRDPKRAQELVEEIAKSGAGSKVLQSDVTVWRKEISAWRIEKKVSLTSDQALFSQAQRLASLGQKNETELSESRNGSVSLLRASGDLHDLLSQYPKSPLRAKSYMMLAEIYGSLPGFAIWDLADEYLGACVVENAHSEVGEECFKKYQQSMTLGYTGSAGTMIPPSMTRQLQRMQNLAARPSSKNEPESGKAKD